MVSEVVPVCAGTLVRRATNPAPYALRLAFCFLLFALSPLLSAQMKILHVIPSLSPKHGGPSFALPLIARSLCEAGVQVDVATTDDDGPDGRLNVPLGQPVERDGA